MLKFINNTQADIISLLVFVKTSMFVTEKCLKATISSHECLSLKVHEFS